MKLLDIQMFDGSFLYTSPASGLAADKSIYESGLALSMHSRTLSVVAGTTSRFRFAHSCLRMAVTQSLFGQKCHLSAASMSARSPYMSPVHAQRRGTSISRLSHDPVRARHDRSSIVRIPLRLTNRASQIYHGRTQRQSLWGADLGHLCFASCSQLIPDHAELSQSSHSCARTHV